MNELCFTVPGLPAPAVRMTQRGKFAKDHPKRAAMDRYLAFKDEIGYRANLAGAEPKTGPVRIMVYVWLANPNTRRWDVSNVLKACEDGLNKIAYRDDKQVMQAEITVRPSLTSDDRTVVCVEYLENAEAA